LKFLFLLFLFFYCSTPKKIPEISKIDPSYYNGFSKREISGTTEAVFFIQPYQNIKIFINAESTNYKILSTDKNIAKIKIQIPIFLDTYGFEITLNDFKSPPKKKVFYHIKDLQDNLLAIDQIGQSNHTFFASYTTGREPKSVRFIDNTKVAVSIMDEEGFDVIDIFNGSKNRFKTPPELNPEKKGFVESLILTEINEIWMSQMSTATIHTFDLNDFHFKNVIHLTGKWSKVMTFDQYKKLVYCSNWSSGDISIIDIYKQKEIEKTKKLYGVPRGMALSEDGNYLYFAQYSDGGEAGGGRVGIYSLKEKKIIQFLGSPGSKRHIISGVKSNQIYVSDMLTNKIELFDMKGSKILQSIPVFHNPNTIVLSPDKKYLYVSCRGPNNPKSYLIKGLVLGKIQVIDTSTHEIVETWETGNQPTGLDISPDGNYLVSTDFLDHRVRVFKRTSF